MRKVALAIISIAYVTSFGCNREEPSGPGNGTDPLPLPMTGPPVCVEPGDCPPDMASPDASPWTPPPPGPDCGQQTFTMSVTRAKPNIHLVLDRSGSMSLDTNAMVPTSSTTAKWEDLSTTLTSILDNYGTEANRWGASLFPDTTDYHSCSAGSIAIPMGLPATAIPAIKNEMAKYDRSNLLAYNGKTPTTAAMQGVVSSVVLDDVARNNYVVLMTDGMPNCAGDPETGVGPLIAQLYGQSPPVRTFVVGFGSETAAMATNSGLLNDWAVQGHTERAGATKYYQAGDAAALMQAFEDIVVGVAQCTFNVTGSPADPSLVVGYINGTAIA